eukprot:CAMPEP_0115376742 /NCGR_PEP_ID=MMETSP0271-20121206/3131_1 /TAXON_ID=71861 /ORGANISM="Scrippsiella trochoidea, Strain CCMP3099" /LENGTH=70 /DNA_ID=CAMNT_0002799839 /DNA_START=1075 /DNA_END=1284 /DNA_ORIENTATION=+
MREVGDKDFGERGGDGDISGGRQGLFDWGADGDTGDAEGEPALNLVVGALPQLQSCSERTPQSCFLRDLE